MELPRSADEYFHQAEVDRYTYKTVIDSENKCLTLVLAIYFF